MSIDILLLFPPTTEARLFPYLSLPMLTAYLKTKNITVHQEDLNIWLSSKIVSCKWFDSLEKKLSDRISEEHNFKLDYRKNLVNFFKRYGDELNKISFHKERSDNFKKDEAVRLSKNAIELALEDSLLKKIIPSLKDIISYVSKLDETYIDKDDKPLEKLKNQIKELLLIHKPKIIGISVSFFSQLLPSLFLAKWIKQIDPSILLILGGQQIMLRYKELLPLLNQTNLGDGFCTGVGKETLEKSYLFLKGDIDKQEIPNIVWIGKNDFSIPIKQSSLKLKDLPPPDFTGLPLYSYLNTENQIPLITCIGCYWGRCAFCSYGNRSFLNGSYQQLSPEKLADHCEQLIQKYQITRFNFVDENNNLLLILKAVRLLNEREYKITFSTRNRLEKILKDFSFCQELAERGCVLMSVGYETNVQRLLDKIDKGVNASYYQEIINNLHNVNISLRFSIMGGIFDETEDEFEHSLKFLKRNASKIGIDVMQMLVLEPETILSKNPQKFSLENVDINKLRGNETLNYLNGRMGYSFDYSDQQSFESKLEKFKEIFNQVIPEKNVDIKPQINSIKVKKETKAYNRLNLYPWVVAMGERDIVLADLQYETFYKLPSFLFFEKQQKCILPKYVDEKSTKMIHLLAKQGLGNPLICSQKEYV